MSWEAIFQWRHDDPQNWGRYWSDPKINFVFVIHKHLFVFCVCHFFRSKINFVGRHKPHSRLKKTYIRYINRIQQKNIEYFFIFFSGELKIHHIPPPDQKPSNAPIFVHSSAGVHCPKGKPAGGGWVILDKRGKGVRGANARWGDDALRSGGRCFEWQRQCKERQCNNQPGQMRGERNERWHDNQTARQKGMTRQKVVARREAMRQPTGRVGGKGTLRSGGAGKGVGRTVAMVS